MTEMFLSVLIVNNVHVILNRVFNDVCEISLGCNREMKVVTEGEIRRGTGNHLGRGSERKILNRTEKGEMINQRGGRRVQVLVS